MTTDDRLASGGGRPAALDPLLGRTDPPVRAAGLLHLPDHVPTFPSEGDAL